MFRRRVALAGRQAAEVRAYGLRSQKRAALYLRVSTLDQHPQTQAHDLRVVVGQQGALVAGLLHQLPVLLLGGGLDLLGGPQTTPHYPRGWAKASAWNC